jgi:alcohol dehydrogenase class IV
MSARQKNELEDRMKGVPQELHRILYFNTAGMTPPNGIIFGFGAVDQLGASAAKLGKGKKAVVISDKILEKVNTVNIVVSALSSAGFSVDTFTDVEPEPHVESAEMLFSNYSGQDCSVIVGLGGGSVMDISKLTAQALASRRRPIEYLNGKVTAEAPGLPLILLPTTAGTGSEVTSWLVVSVGEQKRVLGGPYYFANMAIVDPLLNVTMPPGVTASTGIDALAHAVEAIMNKNANPMTEMFCLGAVKMIAAYLRRAVADGEDLEARYYMSMAATVSMMGLMIQSPGLYAHSVSMIVPRYKPTPHGVGCGLGLPYLMNYNLPVVTEKLARIADSMGEPTWMCSKLEAAKRAVDSVARLIKDVGLPLTLQEYGGLNESDLETMADQMITDYPRPLNPRFMGKKEAIAYWRNMWDGTL